MTQREDLERFILDFLDQEILASDGPQIDPDENLLVSGHVDSLGIMRLVAHLETKLDLKIPPTDLVPDNFRTVRTMASYLNQKTHS